VSDNKAFSTNLNINKDYMYGKISCALVKKLAEQLRHIFKPFIPCTEEMLVRVLEDQYLLL
jgi:hypothetical protein